MLITGSGVGLSVERRRQRLAHHLDSNPTANERTPHDRNRQYDGSNLMSGPDDAPDNGAVDEPDPYLLSASYSDNSVSVSGVNFTNSTVTALAMVCTADHLLDVQKLGDCLRAQFAAETEPIVDKHKVKQLTAATNAAMASVGQPLELKVQVEIPPQLVTPFVILQWHAGLPAPDTVAALAVCRGEAGLEVRTWELEADA